VVRRAETKQGDSSTAAATCREWRRRSGELRPRQTERGDLRASVTYHEHGRGGGFVRACPRRPGHACPKGKTALRGGVGASPKKQGATTTTTVSTTQRGPRRLERCDQLAWDGRWKRFKKKGKFRPRMARSDLHSNWKPSQLQKLRPGRSDPTPTSNWREMEETVRGSKAVPKRRWRKQGRTASRPTQKRQLG
jgi:hypothetical protein